MATRIGLVTGFVLLSLSAMAGAARVSFVRLVPAGTTFGPARTAALVQAIGDHDSIETFVAVLLDQVNQAGVVDAVDLRSGKGPADVYLAVKSYHCADTERTGEGNSRDVDGNRVRHQQQWLDVTCTARVDILSNVMKYQSTFYGTGEGRSPRVESLTEEERSIAFTQAARHAAIDAAARVTPHRVRESVLLDERAPSYEEGAALISADQLLEARRLWEKAIAKDPRSAALRFNLAAVCEALGDVRAAAQHYTAARDLAPAEQRYSGELKLFLKRAAP
jgi:tetratricopeptide (TPR) repeat protein